MVWSPFSEYGDPAMNFGQEGVSIYEFDGLYKLDIACQLEISGFRRISMDNNSSTHKHAIVIGFSMAGLFTARVLSDHFEQVTVIERDPVNDAPESRKGQPQTIHLHGLLAQGLQIINKYFPGIQQSLVAQGALEGDMGKVMRWYQFGRFKVNFGSGLVGMTMTRALLEWQIRQRVLAIPNVTLRASCAVEALITSADRSQVTGVRIVDRVTGQSEALMADLIVDASGRGSAAPKWLEGLGYEKPVEEEVKIRVGYATRMYRRDPKDKFLLMISATPPKGTRGAYLYPVEGDRWILTAGGLLGDHPPADEAGLLEYVRNVERPEVYDIISQAEPLSEIHTYKYPASLRRHYEKLKRFPEGYLVIGDALASFNPIYGQGMTSGILQAEALDGLLQKQKSLHGLWRAFFQRASKVADIPWQLTVGEDFRFPETEGRKSMFTDLLNAYVLKVHLATHHDEVVYAQFLRVMNLMEPPTSLMSPRIMWRVLLKVRSNSRL